MKIETKTYLPLEILDMKKNDNNEFSFKIKIDTLGRGHFICNFDHMTISDMDNLIDQTGEWIESKDTNSSICRFRISKDKIEMELNSNGVRGYYCTKYTNSGNLQLELEDLKIELKAYYDYFMEHSPKTTID